MVSGYSTPTRAGTEPHGGRAHRDTPLPLNAAAREWAMITGTKRPHRATLLRWCTRGCRGIRLVAERAGNVWAVTPAALVEFHRQLNARPAALVPLAAGPARANEIARALRELDSIIGGGRSIP